MSGIQSSGKSRKEIRSAAYVALSHDCRIYLFILQSNWNANDARKKYLYTLHMQEWIEQYRYMLRGVTWMQSVETVIVAVKNHFIFSPSLKWRIIQYDQPVYALENMYVACNAIDWNLYKNKCFASNHLKFEVLITSI